MARTDGEFNAEDLLEHSGWLKGLARSLVSDGSAADDLVQETYLAAMRRPPRGSEATKGWLGSVTRRLAVRARRDETRRRRREGHVARPESVSAQPQDLLERAEAQRQLLDQVLALKEPYRSTVLLRYFEEKTPAEIAAGEEITEATVRWRLSVALRELRARLDRLSGGDRGAWMAALVPAVGIKPVALEQLVGLGGFTMASKSTGLLAGAILVSIAAGLAIGRGWRSGELADDEARTKVEGELNEQLARSRGELEALRSLSAREKADLSTQIAGLTLKLREQESKLEDEGAQEEVGEGEKKEAEGVAALLTMLGRPQDLIEIWRLAHRRGDLEGMERCLGWIEGLVEARLQALDLSPAERRDLEEVLELKSFYRGYTRFARGDFAQARDALTGLLGLYDQKEAELKKQGASLDPAAQVFRMRTRDVLRALDELAGWPAPADFDLGRSWVTPRQASLAASRGKTVALVFRGVNETRSAQFVSTLAASCSEDPDVEMVVIAYHRGTASPEEDAEALRLELQQLGYKGAAGFDPDARSKSLFRKYSAGVGSATFIIVNAQGQVVWFMQDPRGEDVQFARTLLRRAAGK